MQNGNRQIWMEKNYVLKKDFACHLLVYEWIKSIELLNRNGKIQCFFCHKWTNEHWTVEMTDCQYEYEKNEFIYNLKCCI